MIQGPNLLKKSWNLRQKHLEARSDRENFCVTPEKAVNWKRKATLWEKCRLRNFFSDLLKTWNARRKKLETRHNLRRGKNSDIGCEKTQWKENIGKRRRTLASLAASLFWDEILSAIFITFEARRLFLSKNKIDLTKMIWKSSPNFKSGRRRSEGTRTTSLSRVKKSDRGEKFSTTSKKMPNFEN